MTPSPVLVLLLLPPLLLLGALPPAAAARGECWRPARRPGLRQRRPFPSGPEPCPSARLARVPAPRPCWLLLTDPSPTGRPSSPTRPPTTPVYPQVTPYFRGTPVHPWGTPHPQGSLVH